MKRAFLALVGGMCLYELVALNEHRDGDTISEIMWDAGSRYSILPFAMGVLMGHFWWQRARSASRPPAP